MRNRSSSSSPTRKGAVLIVALVCLSFAATVLFGALRTSLQQRRQLRNEHDLVQTEWLLDAGVRLSIEKLSKDSSYVGETTTFKDGLRDGQAGVVKIEVSELKNADEGKTVQVSAKIERPGGKFGIQRSISFNLPATKRRAPTPEN